MTTENTTLVSASLFPGDTVPLEEPPQVDATTNYFELLVGEDKKFKTVQDLAKSKAESDAFIERLKAEQAGLRAELKTRVSLQEFMDKMNTTPQSSATNQETPSTATGEEPKPLTVADLDTLLDQRDQLRRQNQNLDFTKQKLIEAWGPDYAAELKKRAQDLGGLGPEFLDDLAKKQPNAFLKLLDVSTTKTEAPAQNSIFSPPASTVRISNTVNTTKDWNYYEKMRKTNASNYWSPEVQNEMFNAAKTLGDNFYKS